MDLGGIARLERFLDTMEDPGSTDILFPHHQQQEQPIHSRKPRSLFHEFTIFSNGRLKKSVHFDEQI
jgi:ABC-type Fe3+/spermidine/putrescine transport system ATPase subunit